MSWGVAILLAVLQGGPVVLSSADIHDHYDSAHDAIAAARRWLGVFDSNGTSRIVPTRVAVIRNRKAGAATYVIQTTPPNPVMLLSGIPGIRTGPATTVANSIELSTRETSVDLHLRGAAYRIQVTATDPSGCDTVVALTRSGRAQVLFDATKPGTTNDPALVPACDEPHFRIHWAGDIDGDGRLDLLVTFSQKYSYYPRQLLLSSAARGDDLVAEVARSERFSQ